MGETIWYVHKVNMTTEGKENKTVSSFSTKKLAMQEYHGYCKDQLSSTKVLWYHVIVCNQYGTEEKNEFCEVNTLPSV